jgi:hypothetical protein
MESFQKYKYLKIKNLLPDDICKIAKQYFMFDMMNGFHSEKTDDRFPNTHGRYADLLSETLLLYAKPEIEKHIGLELIPTYSFFRIYNPGDTLMFHRDRDACEITCSITIGTNYHEVDEIWPLMIDAKGRNAIARLLLGPGDAAVYKGCELAHGRGMWEYDNENAYHIQLMLHYVDANGPFAKTEKYDKRTQIGIKIPTSDENSSTIINESGVTKIIPAENVNENTIQLKINELATNIRDNTKNYSNGFAYAKSINEIKLGGKSYITHQMDNYGKPLAKIEIRDINQVLSILFQIAVAVAVAEIEIDFEHRDLSGFNVIIKNEKLNEPIARLNGEDVYTQNEDVKVTIIDFGMSKIKTVYNDLNISESHALFTIDLYKGMKDLVKGDWSKCCFKTNNYWLSHLTVCMIGNTKNITYEDKLTLEKFSKRCMEYKSSYDLLKDEIFDNQYKNIKPK